MVVSAGKLRKLGDFTGIVVFKAAGCWFDFFTSGKMI